MDDHDRAQIIEILKNTQPQIAAFAMESYALAGRGAVLIGLPASPPFRGTSLEATDMKYQTIQALRAATADLGGVEARNVLLRMIDTYDPTKQAVVTVAARDTVVSLKMELLKLPAIAGDPGGVH